VRARPRVAFATCAALPDLYADDRLLLAALATAGVDASPAVWDDPAVDWASYDLVVVRSTWDYTLRREEFLDWASSVRRLRNPFELLAWNTDKRYLGGLAAAGVPVVPTTYVAPGEPFEVPAYEHVVKPTVSAGARDTRRFAAGEDSTPHAAALLAAGRTVMVQPYQRAVDDAGETAVLLFRGELSHGARKAPVLVEGLADPDVVAITPRVPSAAEVEVAQAALAAVPTSEPLLYARVDLVPGPDGTPVLMELEATEPCLFLAQDAGAPVRLAAAIRAAL
jgi:hypothetical protein